MPLRAGAARTVITPPLGTRLAGYYHERKAVDVHDDLHARALVLDDGERRLALVVCDLICAPRVDLDRAKALIAGHAGLSPESVLISCTHTHTGPATAGLLGVEREEEYMQWVVPRIADSVCAAVHRLQEVRACWGAGSEPEEVFCRRWHLRDGTVQMNPQPGSPDLVRPEGPTDPQVGLLAFETPEGEPVGALVNYALHYVGGTVHDEVSADYFPLVEAELHRMLDAEFPVLLGNGCCGNINNINFAAGGQPPRPQSDPWAQARHVARCVALQACRAWEQSLRHAEVTIGATMREVSVERRTSTAEQLAQDRELLAQPAPEGPWSQERLFARERVLVAELPRTLDTWVWAGRVGEVGLCGLPGEVFCEFGLAIKERSPFPLTLPIELANDYVGYICTPEAIAAGGYETWLARSSLPTGEAGWKLADAAAELLQSLAG